MGKVLIVDDNKVNTIVLESYLVNLNYECTVLRESTKILETIKSYQPDAILLDLYMPEQDGYQTLEILKTQDDKISLLPVIMTTAETSKSAVAKCLELGAVDYLIKPIDFMDLKARLMSALHIWHLTKKIFSYENKNVYDATTVSANHLINQPLTVAKGNLELLMMFYGDSLSEKQVKLLTRTSEAVQEIADILDSMTHTDTLDVVEYSGDKKMIHIKKK